MLWEKFGGNAVPRKSRGSQRGRNNAVQDFSLSLFFSRIYFLLVDCSQENKSKNMLPVCCSFSWSPIRVFCCLRAEARME